MASGSATGMVVLILRGTCNFSDKINNAAAGGALAAIIYNNRTTDPFRFGGQAVSGANLPTLFMSQSDGQALQALLAATPGLQVAPEFTTGTQFPIRPDLSDFSSRGEIERYFKPRRRHTSEEHTSE